MQTTQSITKKQYSNAEYAKLCLNSYANKFYFLNKQTRDTVAATFKAIGKTVKKSSAKNQRFHPEGLTDFVGTFEVGFGNFGEQYVLNVDGDGNTNYMQYWNTFYIVEVLN